MSPARHHHALPEGYHLHWYEIDSVLGQGGFGITYLARDTNLDQLVAIKEFLPSDLATRTHDSAVQPLSGSHTDTYGWGLNRFLTEARTLAKFRHPNIVRVMSVFEANNTAYMVMEYERGESFENMLKFKQVSGEAELKKILLALLDGLELVHDAGFIHRDIKPSNVYLREDGVPVLLDFGSARLALGVETRTLTSLVSPGYAPFEQYNATRESDKQGPWTDIYALAATMYRAVTGQGPIDAAARANVLLDEQRDPFQACSQMPLEGYSQEFLNAIDRALAFAPADRPQSVAAWRRLVAAGAVDSEAETVALGGDATSAAGVDIVLDGGDEAVAPSTGTTIKTVPMAELEAAAEAPPAAKSSGRGWFVATSIVAVVAVAVVAWLTLAPPGREESAAPVELAATTAQATSGEQPAAERPTQSATEVTAQPAGGGTTAKAASEPVPPAPKPSITEAIAGAAERNASTAAAPAADRSEPTEKKASITDAIAAAAARQTSPPDPIPVQEKPVAKKTVEKKQAPAAPPPAAKKTTPEKVAKAAPAKESPRAPPPAKETTSKKSPGATPPAKKTTSKKSSKPRTREEKIAALLVTADEHLRADRLTKPKKSNALRDYLTVLAMDTNNAAARRGVERIVERYVAKAGQATGAREYDKANEHLRQTRFVLDAMKLRKWPRESYNALFKDYRAASQVLAAAR